MEYIKGDFHLISEEFLKEVLRQPPLDVDYWWKQKRSSSLKGTIIVTIEELRECFKWGMSSFEDTQTPDKSFDDFLQSKGITL